MGWLRKAWGRKKYLSWNLNVEMKQSGKSGGSTFQVILRSSLGDAYYKFLSLKISSKTTGSRQEIIIVNSDKLYVFPQNQTQLRSQNDSSRTSTLSSWSHAYCPSLNVLSVQLERSVQDSSPLEMWLWSACNLPLLNIEYGQVGSHGGTLNWVIQTKWQLW